MKCLTAAFAAAALYGAVVPAAAQNMMNLTPQQQAVLQAKRKKWDKWRENHKQISALGQTMMGFATLEQDPKTQLTPAQAKKVLPILKTWRKKPTMTDEQARKVNVDLTASLTDAQLKRIATAPSFGRGGPGFGGGARMGGGQNPGGQRPAFDVSQIPDPKDYNPLNPDTLPFERMRSRAKQQIDGFITTLEKRAK